MNVPGSSKLDGKMTTLKHCTIYGCPRKWLRRSWPCNRRLAMEWARSIVKKMSSETPFLELLALGSVCRVRILCGIDLTLLWVPAGPAVCLVAAILSCTYETYCC